MEVDLGSFEDFGYADVVRTGKSREETCRILRKKAKELGIKIKIKHVRDHPEGSVVWDVRTGRVTLITNRKLIDVPGSGRSHVVQRDEAEETEKS